MQKFDVVALGELLVDFTENGMSGQGNTILEANPGGAPCNVLSMLQRLGKKTAFIGKVGNDNFGRMLRDVVSEQGINTDNVIFDDDIHTTLAFVHTKEDGDRDFSFYRNPGADMMLRKNEINESLLENTKIFHFGTLSMTEEKIAETTKYAVEKSKSMGAVISFDPNFRPPLWDDFEKAKEQMWYGISKCDVLKISDDEIQFLTGEKDIDIFKMDFQVLNICLHQLGFARSTNTCDNLDVGSTVQLNDPVEIFGSCDCFHIVTHFQKLKKIHFLKLL